MNLKNARIEKLWKRGLSVEQVALKIGDSTERVIEGLQNMGLLTPREICRMAVTELEARGWAQFSVGYRGTPTCMLGACGGVLALYGSNEFRLHRRPKILDKVANHLGFTTIDAMTAWNDRSYRIVEAVKLRLHQGASHD